MFKFGDSDEKVMEDLRSDFKFRVFEKMIRQFFTESLEAVLLKQEYIRDGSKNLLTIGDIATRFKVSKATVHNWLNRGIVKGIKVGKNRYFTEDEIQKYILLYKKLSLGYIAYPSSGRRLSASRLNAIFVCRQPRLPHKQE